MAQINILKLLIAFFLLHYSVFAQKTKQYAVGKVGYEINLHLDKKSKKYKFLLKYFPEKASKIETIDSEFDFKLIFNDSISVFYLNNKLFSDNSIAELAIIHSGYYGRVKQQSKNYITEELQESFGKFRVSRHYQKWELHDESKMIGEYLCFKATTFHSTTNPKGKVFKHNFTAWYAPQLPYRFGPAGYGNLPGLIIELQGDDYTYGVKKIEFFNEGKKNKKNEMPKLKRKKLITEEEFEALAALDEERWRRNH